MSCHRAISLLILIVGCSFLEGHELQMVKRLNPILEEEGKLLVKRDTDCNIFFLLEPPTSLQCNPQASQTLTLRCSTFVSETLLFFFLKTQDIGWYFSSNGEEGVLLQASRFISRNSSTAFEDELVVRN